jgi:hypothetical protein
LRIRPMSNSVPQTWPLTSKHRFTRQYRHSPGWHG